ncbi:MAG TPA: hypothetical protein PKE40_00670 [Arachnia sp.]|nr:hypothetical protein [Arachnia sp.]HMT84839.1 hypothetical protein [Arachnia sp.]
MSIHDDPEYQQAGATAQAVASVPRWPLFAACGLSIAAAAVALTNQLTPSLIAYGALLIAGTTLLLLYRMSVVRATMSADGEAVAVLAFERIAVLAIVLGCLANGVVIGLWVGSWELWFR